MAIALLAGCAPRPVPVIAEPVIAASGASLYLLETRDDWLDDTSHIVAGVPVGGFASEAGANMRMEQPFEPQIGGSQAFSGLLWTGEQGLKVLLRFAHSQAGNALVGQTHFQLSPGSPEEITFHADGVYFRVRLMATRAKNPNYLVLKLNAEKRLDETSKSIAEGSFTVPFGSTILIHHRKDRRRYHVLMLRVASLESTR